MQARPSPRRPLDSWVDDGGSMPVSDGRMRGIRSISERGFLLVRVRSWLDSTVAAIDQRASRHPPIDARGASRCCRSCRSPTPRAVTVITAQTEAVDFFAFDNSYARLPDRFFARLRPTPVAAPHLVRLNKKLAWLLELDPGKLAAPAGWEILPGNRVPNEPDPPALAY